LNAVAWALCGGEVSAFLAAPIRFSENAMYPWLAVRNFFDVAEIADFSRSRRNATAWMFNKIPNLPSLWTLFASS